MSESIAAKVRLVGGRIVDVQITISQNPVLSSWTLEVAGLELPRKGYSGSDLFDALTSLRRVLETYKVQLLCAGARPEVFPSAMAREMGGGRMAYLTQAGVSPSVDDLLDIFDYASPEAVGTVDSQLAFHANWVESLA